MRKSLVLICLIPSLTYAQATNNDLQLKLNQLLGKKGQSDIGKVLATGTLLGCTQKQAGKDATNAFYKEMETTGKRIESYCKNGDPQDARKLAITTLNAKHQDPVALAALNCYESQTENLNKLAGPETAADAARYARWLKDPALASTEMKETDICRNSLKTAAPVAAVN